MAGMLSQLPLPWIPDGAAEVARGVGLESLPDGGGAVWVHGLMTFGWDGGCSTARRFLWAGAGERRWGCRCGCRGRAADRLLVGGGALPTGRGVAGLHPGAGAGTVGGVGFGAALPVVFLAKPRGGPLG